MRWNRQRTGARGVRLQGQRGRAPWISSLILLLGAGCQAFRTDVGVPQAIPILEVTRPAIADSKEFEELREAYEASCSIASAPNKKPDALSLTQVVAEGVANHLGLALATERVSAAQAQVLRARSMVFPNLVAGANFRDHDGPLINTSGFIFDQPLKSIYMGQGAEARGAGAVSNPGIRLFTHLGDAVFEPKAMGHALSRDQAIELAVGNQAILEIQLAYLNLAAAQARRSSLSKTITEQDDLRTLVQNLAKAGQVSEGNLHRVDTELKLTQGDLEKAEEDVAKARINLARVSRRPDIESLEIADSLMDLATFAEEVTAIDVLLKEAWAHRQELTALQHEVAFWNVRIEQERVRPLLPTLSFGFSAGWYSGSGAPTGHRFTALDGRTDLGVSLIWTGSSLGVGNRAMSDIARSRMRSAQLQLARSRDQVARQAVEAYSDLLARRTELRTAIVRVKLSRDVYSRDMSRLRNLEVRPLEVLNGQVQLAQARLDLVDSLGSYASARFNLTAAVGGE